MCFINGELIVLNTRRNLEISYVDHELQSFPFLSLFYKQINNINIKDYSSNG
jgi:hypothetical protein